MAYDVHIRVCFPCDSNDGVAEVARKHRLNLFSEEDGHREARWFLESLALRKGPNMGPKGGLSLWGMTGNYTRVDAFCDILLPFWRDLLVGFEGGPCSFEHVIVFEEREQVESATAYEIQWDDDELPQREMLIKKHEKLPFAWMQF